MNLMQPMTGLYDSAWRSQFFSGMMMPIMQFIGNLGYVVSCDPGRISGDQKDN